MLCKSLPKNSLLALAIFFVCGVASAAVDEESTAPSFRLGGVAVYPGIGVAWKSDSNIFRYGDANPNKRSSTISVLNPSLLMQADKGAHTYSLTYNADVGRYSDSPADNYLDQSILGLVELNLTTRSELTMQPEYIIGHDDRGATYGSATADPNIWHSTGLSGSFTYGAVEARGRVVLDLGYTDYQYQNNRNVTAAYDRKLSSVGGTFYLRVQPKTSLLVTAKHTAISYQQIGSVLNSNEQRLWLGVKWETTTQTSGELRVGQSQKKFDSTLPTYSGGSWEGVVRWSPVTYVNVNLRSSRQTNETTLVGSSTILVSNSGVNIGYDLTERVTLRLSGYQSKEDFVGTSRVDHTDTWGFKAEYQFRSWLIGDAEFTNSTRNSNSPLNDFSRNIFLFSIHSLL